MLCLLLSDPQCGANQFECINGGQCDKDNVIVNFPDKVTAADNCTGRCMPLEWTCDGVWGCTDGTDESAEICGRKLIFVTGTENEAC